MGSPNKTYNRKEFISFLGKASLGAAIVPPFLVSCGNTSTPIAPDGPSKNNLKN